MSCYTCKHYSFGICRRFPPVCVCKLGNNIETVWPTVRIEACCGEHQQKEHQTHDE